MSLIAPKFSFPHAAQPQVKNTKARGFSCRSKRTRKGSIYRLFKKRIRISVPDSDWAHLWSVEMSEDLEEKNPSL